MIGHEKQKKYFEQIIKNGRLGHAYLFTGPEMIGKRTFALELAKNLLGYETGPDLKYITPRIEDDESRIYIEDIRDLKKEFSLKSYGGKWRMIVLNDAHFMTPEASNAFLKLLEEPPAGSTLILISSMPKLLPATIISRCEEVRFMSQNDKEITDYLSEHKKFKTVDRDFILKLSGGRIGFVNYLLDKDNFENANKAIDDLRKLFKAGIFERMEYAKKLNEKGDYGPVISYWLSWVSAHLSVSPKNEKIVKDLLSLNSLVSQPQYNHRLAVENFLLNL
jgi:DNA polymerase-3 subunit delta'